MKTADLKKYLKLEVPGVPVAARVVDPASVVTAPWVAFKCLYGCNDQTWMCPPYSPDFKRTREVLDSYRRGILFHFPVRPEVSTILLGKVRKDAILKLESEIFKDGYYKAYTFASGPCLVCLSPAEAERAGKEKRKPRDWCGRKTGANSECIQRDKARPSMEACGIDVYATARNNGFPIAPLRTRHETRNHYSLIMVD